MTTSILGISAFYHDSAACLVQDGRIVAAAQEERFTRRKHDPGFPHHAVQYCLRQAGVRADQLACVGFYDKPLLTFERDDLRWLAVMGARLRIDTFVISDPARGGAKASSGAAAEADAGTDKP